jgi:murein DD-endopeptidase MepM/ murein hydrolase activator NlpD
MFFHYETKIKAKSILGLAVVLFLIGQSHLAFGDTATTDSASTTDSSAATQLQSSQQKLLQLDQQIETYQQQVSTVESQADTLENAITVYNDQIASNQLSIEAIQTQIDDTKLQIGDFQQLIDQKNQDITDNKTILGQLILELDEYDDQYELETTIGSDNLTDFLDQIQYNQNLQNQVSQLVIKIQSLQAQFQTEQSSMQVQQAQLQASQTQLQVTQTSLTTARDQKQELLNQTQGSERVFQNLLSSSKQDAVNLQTEVETLDAQVKAKLGNKTLNAVPGILAWPIDGIITQGYGNTGFTALGYTFHNGIDIAGPPGQPIYAAADGAVIATDQSDADFGNWVALQSNIQTLNGPEAIVTLYGHMESFVVAVGQQLTQGDLIGYEGNTGNTTRLLYGPERGYHLHFGVYDADGFGVSEGKYTSVYGPYKVPYGETYDPLNFLPPQ